MERSKRTVQEMKDDLLAYLRSRGRDPFALSIEEMRTRFRKSAQELKSLKESSKLKKG